jgi:1,4-alpha-glucan branching enzyme
MEQFIGARLSQNGCKFRVYAPNAVAVHVVGEFNNWSKQRSNLLTKNSDDYWEGEIVGASKAQKYRYLLVTPDGRELRKIDPAARDTDHSGLGDSNNGAFIVDPFYPWNDFNTPRFDDFIIYQLHVGAFAGYHDQFSQGAFQNDGTAKIQFIESKLSYIREMGFNAIQLLPVVEFWMNRSWGYNPSFFFAPESAYGTPDEFRHFVDEAHRLGLAVFFDVVYNHISDTDSSLWQWAVESEFGVYLWPPQHRTDWGWAPSFWKQSTKDFFFENAKMFFEEYRVDGLRLDATRAIEGNAGLDSDGWQFLQDLTWRLKEKYPDRYLIAEHLPDHDTIINSAGFHATWFAAAHHEFQRAANGEDPIGKLKGIIGKNFGFGRNYQNQSNLIKYFLGSHDDCGDDKGGSTIYDLEDWKRHRYFVDFFGGRNNWYARAKARVGWTLNMAAMGTPMLFMGSECHHWGYWHDYNDQYGDHRFDWAIAGDPIAVPMRRLVTAANWVRWNNPAMRSETLEYTHEDPGNSILAFKRWIPNGNNVVLVIVNLGNNDFVDHTYGVRTGGQYGQWTQVLCTQDAEFEGWDGAGNAFYEPWTQQDGMVYVNLPKWSVVVMRLK